MEKSETYYTMKEAAEILGVSYDAVAKWRRLGMLPFFRFSMGRYRIEKSELELFAIKHGVLIKNGIARPRGGYYGEEE